MKKWLDYYLLHMATAWGLGIYLTVVLITVQFVLVLVPFFKIQIGLALQLFAYVPFFLMFPPMIAEKTGDYLPENANYYSAFALTHFFTFLSLGTLGLAYFNLKTSGIQAIVLAEMEQLVSYQGGGFLGVFLNLLTFLPVAFIQFLDDVLLFLFLYQITYLVMVIALERRRLKLVFQQI